MPDLTASRFTPQNRTTNERLSTNTVGLVALSDFRKRRAEVIEQQEREAREAAFASAGGTKSGTGTATPNTPAEGTPDPDDAEAAPVKKKLKKKAKKAKKLLSFDDDEEDDGTGEEVVKRGKQEEESENVGSEEKKGKFNANAAVGVVPKSLTKAALRKEAAEREALRQEFLSVQEAVKATEIAIPFVFYDGVNVPGGTVRVKKGDFTWLFLDKSRKLGAKLGSREDKATRRKQWARVGVDDLLLVRGCAIIPHHYDFYFFVLNKSLGPGGGRIFNYSHTPPIRPEGSEGGPTNPLTTAKSKLEEAKALPDISTLEGANDDPTLTKVVDRRWYERNKHIYPASTWQTFDPEKDYSTEIRRDGGGNTFFFSK
ncbi:hypothetical protein N3K66_002958 [Trichothecium roseum]|uniref:Uncharacterized protein n=1 Tax=Trichothecium roseum TaxID=47278 RepID=A0ACC0V419_9HYPO|nr:hypothetical protein N3K66_002958 [Trichothecium roseum]